MTIEIRDLQYRYGGSDGDFRLRVPAFSLDAGETATCIGQSGSGKTTLLHIMAGILLARGGEVVVGGADWRARSPAERRRFRIQNLGLVFQEFELLEHLTVRENILLPYLVDRSLILDPAAEARLRELAQIAGIEKHLARWPRKLSQGERQRVAICRALVTQPSLILADEPTGNLDPQTTQRIIDLLLQEVQRRSISLVMVTHDHGLLGSFGKVLDLDVAAGPHAEVER